MGVKLKEKVYLGDQKTAFRVVKIGKLNGEKAVGIIRQADYTAFNKGEVVQITRWIPVADLVRDDGRRGWRERWRQMDIPFT